MAPKIITVINQKGGPGKTTMTANLAAALAGSHLNVLAVDADTQATLKDWSEDADRASNDGAGEPFPFTVTATRDLDHLRRLPATDFDVVLIDTPGHFDNLTPLLEAVTDASDLAIIPVELNRNAVRPLLRTVKTVLEPKGVAYRCVLNKLLPGRGQSAVDAARASLDSADLLRCETYIRSYQAYADAVDAAQLVSQISNGNARNATEDYSKLALELLGGWDSITTRKES